MQRPDAMLIKRFLGKHARGDGDDARDIVNRAMDVPLLDFSHKDDARDFEWSMSSQDFIKEVDHWTLADGDEIAVEVAEWAFDEFVFVYRRPLLMQDVVRPSDRSWRMADEEMQATVWAYINTDVQDPFLTQMNGYWPNVMEGLDELRVERGLKDPVTAAYYTTQYVMYDGEPWVYRWDGWVAIMR